MTADDTQFERLRAWKAEALPVIAGLQEVGRALGTPLGQQITARATVDLALDLRNQRDEARAEADRLRVKLRAVVELAEDIVEHGLRFDLNPTINARQPEVAYLAYIQRMDDHAREVGNNILAAVDPVSLADVREGS